MIIHDRFTLARYTWLRKLDEEKLANRSGSGPVAFHCMRLGWTQWSTDETGRCLGEELTELGKEKLASWEGK